jgi:hypothetical protein
MKPVISIIFTSILCTILISAKCQRAPVANVLDYGFTDTDATKCIQDAINSKAKKVLIPYIGKTYIVKPLFATSNDQEIFFEPGVVLEAMKGEFHESHCALITILGVKNVTLTGYGATLRMHKEDYQNPKLYTPSEWRHALEIRALIGKPTENITIKGFHSEKSGGDGFYVGGEADSITKIHIQPYNVLLQDVVAYDNHRQGFSITGAEKLKIINGVFIETKGTPPEAGIDWEPEYTKMADLEMQNCYLLNNVIGLDIFLWRPPETGPLDMQLTLNNVHVDSDPDLHKRSVGLSGTDKTYAENDPNYFLQKAPLSIGYISDRNGYRGNIIFNDCSFRNDIRYAVSISNKSALRARITFNRCLFEQTHKDGTVISLSAYGKELKGNMTFGGIEFNNCIINDHYSRPFMTFSDMITTGNGIRDIQGNIIVNDPFGAKMALGNTVQNIGLKVLPVLSAAPEIKILAPSLLQTYKTGDSFRFSAQAFDAALGAHNGQGIKQVNFSIRRGDKIVAASEDRKAPYEISGRMTGWEPGIYLLKVEALSSDSQSTNGRVIPFEIKEESKITKSSMKKLKQIGR